jgi:hypothetical protein
MCYADVTPFLNTDGAKGIQPDFNTQHRCPKFDSIQLWAKQRELMADEVHTGHHDH